MRTEAWLLAVFLVFLGCIGWNSDQKEVVENYRAVRLHVQNEDWRRLNSSFTENTEALVSALAELYTEKGAPFENDPEIFLEAMAIDTDIMIFPETILSVDITGNRAFLTAGDGEGTYSYEFRKESGNWKLNFEPVLTELFQNLMQGIPDLSDAAGTGDIIPSHISRGSGPCLLIVRNDLNGLAIHNVFCSLSSSDSWGEDLLGPSILGTGSELGLNLEEGTYDVQIYDSMERSFTVWQVDVDENGVLWEVTEADLDI